MPKGRRWRESPSAPGQSGVLEVVRAGDAYELALPAIATVPEQCRQSGRGDPLLLKGAEPLEGLPFGTGLQYLSCSINEAAGSAGYHPIFAGLEALGTDQFYRPTAPGDCDRHRQPGGCFRAGRRGRRGPSMSPEGDRPMRR